MTSSLGKLFTITSFGESHGPLIGVVIDGCPAGLPLAEADIQPEVDRRRPGAAGTTGRREEDRVEISSGLHKGRTTGAPLYLLVRNHDVDSSDYDKNRGKPRPGHADYTAGLKYGGFADHRGGGRFSGRITVGFVMAGAVAKKLLATVGAEVLAHTVAIGSVSAGAAGIPEIKKLRHNNPLACADAEAAARMSALIEHARQDGDSLGGIIEGLGLNLPAGLGEPVFDTLEGAIAKAMFSIPAVKGVEFGAGFAAAKMRGSEHNDPFTVSGGKVVTKSNQAGGILGGISTGMPLRLRVAVKPTPSISSEQATVDIGRLEDAKIKLTGRHDTCIVPRAVPVVEAMLAVTLCDFAIRAQMIAGVLR